MGYFMAYNLDIFSSELAKQDVKQLRSFPIRKMIYCPGVFSHLILLRGCICGIDIFLNTY